MGRVKEALFDILSTRINGSLFLDLYAGTGSIGLEAHSRGASTVIFVEQNRKTAAFLCRNVKRYCAVMPQEPQSALHIYTLGVEDYLAGASGHTTAVDIIFADPPYDIPITHTLMDDIAQGGWLQPNGALVVEHRFKNPMDDTCGSLLKTRTYRYGDSALSIYTLTCVPPTTQF